MHELLRQEGLQGKNAESGLPRTQGGVAGEPGTGEKMFNVDHCTTCTTPEIG